jgi:hypothetical protein
MQMVISEKAILTTKLPKGNFFTLEFFYKGNMTTWTDSADGVVIKKGGTTFI